MAVPTGAASMQDIQDEHGGSYPISLSEYYGVDTGVPTSGAISIDDLRGTSADQVRTVTEGTSIVGSVDQRGFSLDVPMGGISAGGLNGAAIQVLLYQEADVKGFVTRIFILRVAGVRAKSFFTSMTLDDTTGTPTFTSASATHSDDGSNTTWSWDTGATDYSSDWNGSGTQDVTFV